MSMENFIPPLNRRSLLIQCLNCKNRAACREESWGIALDELGRCHSYIEIVSQKGKAGFNDR